MTEAELLRANEIRDKIFKLDMFLSTANKVWNGRLIKERYLLKAKEYGAFQTRYMELDKETFGKVILVLEMELMELKRELESI